VAGRARGAAVGDPGRGGEPVEPRSGASGLAVGYAMLLATRCLVGIGEAAYAPVASAMLSDAYPLDQRGKVLACSTSRSGRQRAGVRDRRGLIAGADRETGGRRSGSPSPGCCSAVCFAKRELPAAAGGPAADRPVVPGTWSGGRPRVPRRSRLGAPG
jgi:hypothetical protein